MYRRPTCIRRECNGKLEVRFDDYNDPKLVHIACGRCGFVVYEIREKKSLSITTEGDGSSVRQSGEPPGLLKPNQYFSTINQSVFS